MKKIILDCDPGMDDSMAIVMAVKSPEVDVKAITTVNGNYPVDITALNALKVLEIHLPMEWMGRRRISFRILWRH